MLGRYEDSIYEMLSGESVIPGKVAGRLDVDYKIAGDMLMHLALTRKDAYVLEGGV